MSLPQTDLFDIFKQIFIKYYFQNDDIKQYISFQIVNHAQNITQKLTCYIMDKYTIYKLMVQIIIILVFKNTQKLLIHSKYFLLFNDYI